jgi:hypothetical protein
MENRELGLLEIKERIKADRIALGLSSFKRTPTRPSNDDDTPCVFMLEGIDNIFKRASRNMLGYPAQRSVEVIIELVVNVRQTPDIKALFLELRKTVFKVRGSDPVEYSPIVADNVFINENRTEGPIGYGLPDIKVMRLVLDLIYTDGGF